MNKRPEYNPADDIQKAIRHLSAEQLKDKALVMKTVKDARIKATPIGVGRVRVALLRGRTTQENSINPYDHVEAVLKIEKKVGGFENLLQVVSLIEKIRRVK